MRKIGPHVAFTPLQCVVFLVKPVKCPNSFTQASMKCDLCVKLESNFLIKELTSISSAARKAKQ